MHDVAIIGAGPYGLSLAAHLAATDVDFRIFGVPMQTWRQNMPQGMHLKSEGFASTLYDPAKQFHLSRYCSDHALDYADTGNPVSIDTFANYGLAFQRRFVPGLEQQQVVSVARQAQGFAVTLEDGQTAQVRSVVLAVGITHYAHLPEPFASFPRSHTTHSSTHSDYSHFAGRDVIVVGGGASATDCAIELVKAGASVRILARRPRLSFHNPPKRRSLSDRLLKPTTSIGGGWKSVFLTQGPHLFHRLPQAFRHKVTRRFLGPAACWFTRSTIDTEVEVETGVTVTGAALRGDRIELTVSNGRDSTTRQADHVIAATGYKVDLGRLTFIEPGLLAQIKTADRTPVLSPWFESSVPGLYFVGVSAANAFGPLVRFASGAQFTARRLSKRLNRVTRASPVIGSPAPLRPTQALDRP